MSSIPITYHAEWWVPAKADLSQKELSMIPEGMEKKYAGNLTRMMVKMIRRSNYIFYPADTALLIFLIMM